MSEEIKSKFDGFEIDEETGEVLIPRASVGVVKDMPEEGGEGSTAANDDYIATQADEEELPELHFDFDFGEEEFAENTETMDEERIMQSIDEALAAQMAASLGSAEEEVPVKKEKRAGAIWMRIPTWCKVTMISLCSICLILVLLVGTKPGQEFLISMVAEYLSNNFARPEEITPGVTAEPVNPDNTLPTQTPDNSENDTTTPGQTVVPVVEPRQEDYVYNVLLIGEEALPELGGGRSDSMILVSVNSKTKKIYMTSMMRDMYVQIPGYSDNKLNAAFAYGGASLLTDTIEQNLQVKIDGYVKVGFDSFEWIVDRLGGVEITLTAEEAEYLRTTNYISKKENRNVVAGTQIMNGNQALGYCRVRYVPTANGVYNDFGRTERQRTILTKMFNKVKDTNILTLLSILNDCLPQVLTNISKSDMQQVMENVLDNRILNLESYRVPAAGTYESAIVGKQDVIIVKWEKNIEELHNRIFATGE